jgi:hypothetical protein
MIPEEEAAGKVETIYEEIKPQPGIEPVTNLCGVMASKPDDLESNWSKVKAVKVEPAKLDRLTKEISLSSVIWGSFRSYPEQLTGSFLSCPGLATTAVGAVGDRPQHPSFQGNPRHLVHPLYRLISTLG